MIDDTARIDSSAEIDNDVEIGPWVLIGPGVRIAAGTRIDAHCIVRGPTTIGPNNHIAPFCSIGDDPQDKKFSGGDSRLEIGAGNTFREYCSVNRGTAGGGGVTRIGDDNWIMAYCHIAHDCQVGNHTVFANNATLAGHVEIHDYAILGGFTGVHQFCRLGENSFTAIAAIVVRDVPPFVMVHGNTASPRSINREGLKRRGFSTETIATLKQCYRALYREGRSLEEATGILRELAKNCAPAQQMLDFILTTERGLVR